MALEKDQEKLMPIYEYECGRCKAIREEFFRSIPRVVPDVIVEECTCSPGAFTQHMKIMSKNTFHLKGGGVGWGAGRYSSAAMDGSTPVSIDEPS